MSKGSKRRPAQITDEEWADRWVAAFTAGQPEPEDGDEADRDE